MAVASRADQMMHNLRTAVLRGANDASCPGIGMQDFQRPKILVTSMIAMTMDYLGQHRHHNSLGRQVKINTGQR